MPAQPSIDFLHSIGGLAPRSLSYMAAKATTPPPAYFLSLSLENVRSFGDKQTISFARPDGRPAQWTILLGDNGVGKTTVLRALAMLKQTNQHNDISAKKPRGRDGNFYWEWRDKWWPVRSINEKTAKISFQAQAGKLTQTSVQTSAVNNAIEIIGDNDLRARDYEDCYTSFIPKKLSVLICYGYGAGRTTGNSTLSETPEAVDTCASLFDDRADLLNPEEWFLFADYRMAKDKDPLTTQNFHLIKGALLKVMEEGEVTDLEVVAPSLPGRGSPRQGVRFQTPYGWVRLRDMSLGYQTLVVWLTDFASKLFVRYPDSPNPLEEPAIVLIDEIDLHLHPSWQRKLLKSLSEIFPNTQFIATAHSPLVVQAAGDEGANVVLLKREGDQTVVYQGQDLPDVRAWRIDQILNSELFDDVPAYSEAVVDQQQRRDALLAKKKLTAKEKAELADLNRLVHEQPVGESAPERRAADVLRELARKLGKQELLD